MAVMAHRLFLVTWSLRITRDITNTYFSPARAPAKVGF